MYDLIRVGIAILLAAPVVLIPVFRHTFQARKAFFLVSAGLTAFLLASLLYQWPFENLADVRGHARDFGRSEIAVILLFAQFEEADTDPVQFRRETRESFQAFGIACVTLVGDVVGAARKAVNGFDRPP